MAPRVLILRAPGTNCDRETAFAFERAGGRPELVHVGRLLEKPQQVADFQIACFPGGFSYGDDLAAGRILGSQIRHHLADVMQEFKQRGGLILGICNGFQILAKSGLLLPDDPQHGPPATLAFNASGKFEDRWVNLASTPGKCVFLQGIERMYLPVAHAEGRFRTRDEATFLALEKAGQCVLRYTDGSTTARKPGWAPQVPYPACPNGAAGDVAGVCDSTGRVLGLMPHPERHIDVTHHPRWTRGEGKEGGDGLKLFQNAVGYFK